MMKKSLIFTGMVCAAALCAQGQRAPVVAVSEVIEMDRVESRKYTGVIVAPEIVQVVPRVSGEIVKVGFKDGEFVKKDQALYCLDDIRYKAVVAGINAKIDGIKAKISSINAKIEGINANIAGIDANIAGIDAKIKGVSARISSIDANIAGIDAKIASSEAKRKSSKAKQTYAQQNYERTSKLFKDKAASLDNLQNRKSALDAANADLASADADLMAAKANRAAAIAERNIAVADRSAAEAERKSVQANRKTVVAERKAVEAERAAAIAEQKAAEAERITALENLKDTVIKSPIDGVAGVNKTTFGNYLTPGSGVLVTIVKINPIRVRFAISTNDFLSSYGTLKRMQEVASVKVRLSNGKEYPLEGQVKFLNNEANSRTDAILVYAEFKNDKQILINGSTVTVTLNKKDKNKVLAIPLSAVVYDMKGACVYVVGSDSKAKKQYIVPCGSDSDYQYVSSGISKGQKVISAGTHKVMVDGMPVQLSKAAGK